MTKLSRWGSRTWYLFKFHFLPTDGKKLCMMIVFVIQRYIAGPNFNLHGFCKCYNGDRSEAVCCNTSACPNPFWITTVLFAQARLSSVCTKSVSLLFRVLYWPSSANNICSA